MISMANICSQAVSIALVTKYYLSSSKPQLPEDIGKFLFVIFVGGMILHIYYLRTKAHGHHFSFRASKAVKSPEAPIISVE
jgi:hypothetical protein